MSDVKYQILTASELREASKKANDEILYKEVFHKIKSAAEKGELFCYVKISRVEQIDRLESLGYTCTAIGDDYVEVEW